MIMKYWNQGCSDRIYPILFFLLSIFFLSAGGIQAASVPAGRIVNWSQLPDLSVYGDDHPSNNKTGDHTLVADDFMSDGRPIAGIHWWGSYLGSRDTIDGFWIKLWSDDTGAVPGRPYTAATDINNEIFSMYFTFDQVNEEYYGHQEGPNLAAYQYYVDFANEPFYEEDGTVYWISIQAVGSTKWGWKYTYSDQGWRDEAVFSNLAYDPLDANDPWPTGTSEAIEGKNMAFELTTVPIPRAALLLGSGLLGLIGIRRRTTTSDQYNQ